MDKFIADNPATKRLLLGLFGAVIPLLNAKFGLNIPPDQMMASMALIASMIAGSNWKEAKIAGAEAAAAVTDVKSAVAVLNAPGPAQGVAPGVGP